MKRLVIGNLDSESELAACSRDESRRPATLSLDVRRTTSAFATLLRALAGDDDRLWTPVAVDSRRLPDIPGLPSPRLVSGPLEMLEGDPILAWAETPTVERLRAGNDHSMAELDGPLREILWRLRPASSSSALQANRRGFCLETALELDCALPGARRLRDPGELESHLESGGAAASKDGRWVMKAPYSAAGRWRYVGQGGYPDELPARRTIENLFSNFGELLFEPWMERTEDHGCCALVTAGSFRFLGAHRQEVDARGRFRGVDLRSNLSPSDDEELARVAEHLADKLRAIGYRGPFSVDCWRYRDRHGAEHFHPLGELNARMSFGLVARALAERLVPETEPNRRLVRLCFDRVDRRHLTTAEGMDIQPLVLPTGEDPIGVWLEPTSSETDLPPS